VRSDPIGPATAWKRLVKGNQNFINGTPEHPRQDVEHRTELAQAQFPDVALFGCADSRLSAEIIFDKGLGDLFVVRNAGQVISNSVVGSLEYAVEMLGISLILVLSHDNCGAVQAAIEQDAPDATPLPAHIQEITAAIAPAVTRVRLAQGLEKGARLDPNQVGQEHLRDTVSRVLTSSELISAAIAEGKLAVVGANYRLAEGRVTPDVIIGSVE
jgi:carbonic anhydrase